MSRSKKKNPILPVCFVSYGAMKKWKKECNRKLRRNYDLKEDIDKTYKKINDIWNSPSDGWWRSDDPKVLRK